MGNDRCSYGCPYFKGGAVMSICTKYDNAWLQYKGKTPPLKCEKCVGEMKDAEMKDAEMKVGIGG